METRTGFGPDSLPWTGGYPLSGTGWYLQSAAFMPQNTGKSGLTERTGFLQEQLSERCSRHPEDQDFRIPPCVRLCFRLGTGVGPQLLTGGGKGTEL